MSEAVSISNKQRTHLLSSCLFTFVTTYLYRSVRPIARGHVVGFTVAPVGCWGVSLKLIPANKGITAAVQFGPLSAPAGIEDSGLLRRAAFHAPFFTILLAPG